MGSLYFTETANWLRNVGLEVVEYDGWKTRARSTGGFDPGRPVCIMWHHTASNTTPENDCYYMCYTSDSRPISNVLLDRTGRVWVLAAGATNTNGKGKSLTFSKGTVPADSMNTWGWGMEIANDGLGESYPQVQIDAAFKVSICMGQVFGCQPSDICTHQNYAPDRKIDPATASAVKGSWTPRSINSSGTWNLQDLIDEHTRRWNAGSGTGGGELTDADKQWLEEMVERKVRDVLNEGAPFGTGGNPNYPGRPWAEGNANLTPIMQSTFNNTEVIKRNMG